MKLLGSVLFAASLVALGCSGQPAQGSGSASASTPSKPEVQGAAPLLGTTLANTGYITAPALVSAGMTQILAYVPAQAGATYAWSAANGTIPGVTQNAAVYVNAAATGPLTVTCAVKEGGTTTTYSQAIPVLPAMPLTTNFYGSGYSADALANTVVGGPSQNVVSYRFQARYTTPLKGCRVFFIWSTLKAGYASGQGGTVRVDLMADDGTVAHAPGGPVLATTTYGNILAQDDYYPELTFPNPVALKGGGLYHLVFTNIDATPAANYISLDALYTDAQTAPMQPVSADTNLAVLCKSGTGAWKLRQGYTPAMELDFTTGSQGVGYMEVWSTNPKTISGTAAVREAFKVTGPSRTFSKVLLRLERLSGSSPLTLKVTEADGTLVDQVTVPAANFLTTTSNWVTADFPLSHVLNSGVAYNLTLSSPADTSYSAYPMRKGLDKGFSTSTVFPDGYAEFTTNGTAWQGWDMWGTPNLTDSDLQFAFIP